jgi:four helix bundle protein
MVWQRAKAFASEVYRQTRGFPKIEIYGWAWQLRRAADLGSFRHRPKGRAG